jgi:hypothetical protein
VLKLKKPVEQLATLLGMLRQLLVMGLVTQLKAVGEGVKKVVKSAPDDER